ncbi:MAG: LamG-like jellyroll fold domain-containing protein [Armatimonadota bacterium]|nr:LamG-like jellyroll fold domain-containing protein [Armatimonadota bacterium]
MAVAQEPRLLFYLSLDETARAAWAAGETPVGGASAADVILYELAGRFEDGRVGRGRLFERGGVEYLAEGNLNRERGTLALWAKIGWDGTREDLYCTFFGMDEWGLLYKYTDQTLLTFGWIKSDGQFDYGCTADIARWRAGQWHHIAITWDAPAGVRHIYLDGALAAEGGIPSMGEGDPRMSVGISYTNSHPARSVIDELYIWDRPLTAEQIAQVRAAGLAGERAWELPPGAGAAEDQLQPPAGERPPLPGQVDWSLDDAERLSSVTRLRVCLNGLWRFHPDADSDDGWCLLRVPGVWTSPSYVVRDADFQPVSRWGGKPLREWHRAWYERTFELPDDWPDGRQYVLGLDSVRSVGEVFLNGRRIGRAREYERARFDVSEMLEPDGENLLQVHVLGLGGGWSAMRGIDADVWLEARPPGGVPKLSHVALRPRVSQGLLEAGAYFDRGAGRAAVQVEIADAGGEVVRSLTGPVQPVAGDSIILAIEWPDAHLWTPADPYLYSATVRLVDGDGRVLDELPPERFGMRELTIRDGDFYLNGVKIHLVGQASPPFGQISFCAAEEYIREWYRRLRAVGCFAVREYTGAWRAGYRCVWRELYYDIADEMGMIIFSHVPGAGNLWQQIDDERVREGLHRRIADYVARYGNHACCAMWFQHFNTGAYTGDIRPDWMDGSHPPDEHPEMRHALFARHAAMRWCEEQLREIDRDARPIFHHAAGDFGEVYTCNAYLNFDIPLQEREEWPSAWAQVRHKPLMPVETGFPCILSWYQERHGSLADVYASEPLFEEYAAATLGDRPYEALPDDAMDIIKPGEWHCNLDRLKYGLPSYQQLKEVWGERTVRSWRTWGISHCQHVEYRDCWEYERVPVELSLPGPKQFGLSFDADEPTIQRATRLTPLGEAMQRANMPVLAYIAGPPDNWPAKDHAFFAGERFERTLVAINDRFEPLPCRLHWALRDADGARLDGGSLHLTLQPGEISRTPISLVAPEVARRTELTMTLDLRANGRRLSEDELPVQVWPRPPRPEVAEARVGLIDAGHGTAGALREAGVAAEPVGPATDLQRLDVLIVGARSFDAHLLGELHAQEAMQGGLRVIVFEQTQPYGGLLLDDPNARHVFIRAPEHPLLAGLTDADLADWRGQSTLTEPYPVAEDLEGRYPEEFWRWSNNGTVASFAFEKPQRGGFEVLADCSFDSMYTPLLAWRIGRGRALLCQLDVTSRYGRDPVATLLVHRMLEWAAGAGLAPEPGGVAYLGGEQGRALLWELGCEVERVPSSAGAANAALLVIGEVEDATTLSTAPRPPALMLLPQALPDVAEALGLATEPAHFFRLQRPPTPNPAFRGLCAADLYLKQWVEAPALVGEDLAVTAPAVAGRTTVGGSTVYICGIDPGVIQGQRQRAKALRLVATILSNAAAEANVSLPALDIAAGSVEVASEGSPYALEALTYNPYEYRRW